jgi:hypothetical protein
MVKCRRATREELQTCHSEAYVHMYASSARHRDLAVFGESDLTFTLITMTMILTIACMVQLTTVVRAVHHPNGKCQGLTAAEKID